MYKCKRCGKVWRMDVLSHKVKGCIVCLHAMDNPTYEKLFKVKLVPYPYSKRHTILYV